MLQARHLLDDKGHEIYAIGPDDPVLAAIRAMAERGIGALLVLSDDQLAGIVSERDYARNIILKGRSSADTPVRDIMVADVVTVAPTDSVETCMRLCTEHRVRHLPVLEDGKVIGVLSIGDLVKAVISEQSAQIEHLQRYIAG
jgi:CBS domain-containing protein